MAQKLQFRRMLMLVVLLGAAYAGLGYRLVDLQVLRHGELSARAQRNTQFEVLLEPRRGDILDTKDNLLATSIMVKTVCADPAWLGNRQTEVARALAPLLQMPENRLVQSLTPKTRRTEEGETVTNRYVVLKHKVSLETWDKIQTAMSNLTFGVEEKSLPKADRAFYRNLRQKTIFARDDQLRVYPNQGMAAHILGFASTEEREVNDTPVREILGREGIELMWNEKLSGMRGWRVTETDRSRRELVPMREQNVPPRDGLNVVLTIDSVIQHYVESALAEAMEKHSPISISGVVVRPRTGEILAMATLPSFNPNNPGKATPEARRNRVVADVAEPGSTFKVVVTSGALNDGTVRLTDSFDCEHGRWHYGGRVLHDHESYGVLTVERIITKSSNIGAAKIGLKMGDHRLYDYIRNFGFGERTGIPLQGEVAGIVHPVEKWSKVSLAQIPMGHGIAVTRLQMIMAMCAIANQGMLMRPMLVDRLEDKDHKVVARYAPQRVRQVISETAARQMVQALKTVVATNGTAAKAALEHYVVAGKTGTAQKVEGGVYVHKYFSSFIGFFPADNPEVCISVTLDDPKQGYYGGQIATPIFKQIAERTANYLGIPPEMGETPAGLDTPAAAGENRALKTAALPSAPAAPPARSISP